MTTIHSFNEISFYDFKEGLVRKIKSEINNINKNRFLEMDEEVLKDELMEKYLLEGLEINKESEKIDTPSIKKEYYENIHGRQQRDVYCFLVNYNYLGSSALFKVSPSSRIITSHVIMTDEYLKTVSFEVKTYNTNVEEFKLLKEKAYTQAFTNIININKEVNGLNYLIKSTINNEFNKLKNKYIVENAFFEAINVRIDKSTKSIFTPPVIQKKIIPQLKSTHSRFTSEPTMSEEMYNDILKVIYDSGKSMERKPSLYRGKDEEALRDQFLFILETRYDNTTATGETFNRKGKTDIVLKFNDGTNLFVAECKFWQGESEMLNAISQLFDRYLTWRDSKAALIFFVKNKDFTKTIQTIEQGVPKHEYYIKKHGVNKDSSLSYIFCLPQDKDKQIFLEVIAFHYDL